jgi:YihY family inner membrane protein
MGGILGRIDAMQRRHPSLAFPFAVIKKFSEDQSSNLAVLITYYAFFSIFPLLLALSSALGFVLAHHPEWQMKVTNSALKSFPLIGNNAPPPIKGNLAAVVVGGALALYSGLGVAKTAQTAWDTVYLVAHTDQPGFLPKTLRALRLIAVGGLGLIATTVLSGVAASGKSIGVDIGPLFTVLGVLVAVVLNALLFTVLFRWLTVRIVSFRDALPGAIIAAVALAALQAVASAFISHKLKGANATYGSFGTVIVLLSWFYLQSQVVLLAAQVNVVRQYHLWPRALHDPPDTEADFRAYEGYAERERYQAQENVDTSYSGADDRHEDSTTTRRRRPKQASAKADTTP